MKLAFIAGTLLYLIRYSIVRGIIVGIVGTLFYIGVLK